MKRITMILTVALVIAAMMLANLMPAFAQGRGEGPQGVATGPEGGNPGQGVPQTQAEHPSGATVDRNPSPSGARSLRRVSTTLHRALFAPLRGLLSVPQGGARVGRTKRGRESFETGPLFLSSLALNFREPRKVEDRRIILLRGSVNRVGHGPR